LHIGEDGGVGSGAAGRRIDVAGTGYGLGTGGRAIPPSGVADRGERSAVDGLTSGGGPEVLETIDFHVAGERGGGVGSARKCPGGGGSKDECENGAAEYQEEEEDGENAGVSPDPWKIELGFWINHSERSEERREERDRVEMKQRIFIFRKNEPDRGRSRARRNERITRIGGRVDHEDGPDGVRDGRL
jgi:hypothetical protein